MSEQVKLASRIHKHHGPKASPVDGGGPSVQRQQRRVVDDGAVRGVVDHVHGDELGAEGHHVELGADRFVSVHHLRDGLPFDSPPGELKQRRPVFLRGHSCNKTKRFWKCLE